MLRWLYQRLDKRFGAEKALSPMDPKEWAGMLANLADGYEKHEPVFRAIQIQLRKTERMAFRVPALKTPADLELWKAEQYGLVREANALRFILRLPIEGQKLIAKHAAEKERKAMEPEEEEDADLD